MVEKGMIKGAPDGTLVSWYLVSMLSLSYWPVVSTGKKMRKGIKSVFEKVIHVGFELRLPWFRIY